MFEKDSTIDIRVGGTSAVKIQAVERLKSDHDCIVKGVKKSSGGVNEQPIGIYETTTGAVNRAMSAWRSDPSGDVYFGIESGLIPHSDPDAGMVDAAFIAMWIPEEGVLSITLSDGCFFPMKYIKETEKQDGGFVENTVGKTMAACGFVADHADPHQSLMGVSRGTLIGNAVLKAVAEYQAKIQ